MNNVGLFRSVLFYFRHLNEEDVDCLEFMTDVTCEDFPDGVSSMQYHNHRHHHYVLQK